MSPRARTVSNSSRHSDHAHHRRTFSTESRDSMVLLQIMQGEQGMVAPRKEDDYDHLVSKKDFGHLCECTYGRVNVQLGGDDQRVCPKGEGHTETGSGAGGKDGAETHKADII